MKKALGLMVALVLNVCLGLTIVHERESFMTKLTAMLQDDSVTPEEQMLI